MRNVIVLILCVVSAFAHAQETVTPSPSLERAMLKFGGALKVEGWFKGPGNLTGVAAKFNGQPMVFFTDPEGRYMLTGTAVDITNGKNLIAEATARYFANFGMKRGEAAALPVPKKTSIRPEELNGLASVRHGNARTGKVAYVLFDFECEHCMALYHAIAAQKPSGELRWIPVAFSGEAAASKAALALGAGRMDSVVSLEGKSLADSVKKNKAALGRGALLLEKNMQFLQSHNIGSTPRFFYEKSGTFVEHDGFASTDRILEELGVQ